MLFADIPFAYGATSATLRTGSMSLPELSRQFPKSGSVPQRFRSATSFITLTNHSPSEERPP